MEIRKIEKIVHEVIMEDLSNKRYPFHYMILEKIPGRDLRFELGSMTFIAIFTTVCRMF